MSVYQPDRWVVLKFDYNGDVIDKVFGGWYGGFAQGDSWKLSSGITKVDDHGDYFVFENHSGSLYKCFKAAYGMSGYMSNMHHSFEKQLENVNNVTMCVKEEYESLSNLR